MDSKEHQHDQVIPLLEENSNQQNPPINLNRTSAASEENFLDPQLELLSQLVQQNPGLLQQTSLLTQLGSLPLGSAQPTIQNSQLQQLQQMYLLEQLQALQNQNLIQQLQHPDHNSLSQLIFDAKGPNSLFGGLSQNLLMPQMPSLFPKESPIIGGTKSEDQQQIDSSQLLMLQQLLNPMYSQQMLNNCLFSQMVNKPLLNHLNGGILDLNGSMGLNSYQDSKDYSDQKIKRKHIKKQHNPQYNTGHWTSQEHQMYMTFLFKHKEVMESPELKKTNKIFKLMSDIIKSRSPSQCRSHHQKFNPFSKYVQNVNYPNIIGQNVVRRKMKSSNPEEINIENLLKQEPEPQI